MALTVAPPALEQVAQRFTAATRGVVGYQLHRVLDVRAGFSRRHEDLSMHVIAVDETIVRVRIESYAIDGHPASPADSQNMAQAYEAPQIGQRFRVPFDPHYRAAYHFSAMSPETMAFTSTIRDAAHGNGSFTYDAGYDVVTYTYQPKRLPPHASSGDDHRQARRSASGLLGSRRKRRRSIEEATAHSRAGRRRCRLLRLSPLRRRAERAPVRSRDRAERL